MPSPRIRIAEGAAAGGGAPLLLIAGPDSIESEAHALRMANALKDIARARGLVLVYKSSFDKANRTSASSFRGPGLRDGLAILARVKKETGLPVTTDFHTPEQAALLAPVIDLLQVPAMLSRQTDVLVAAAKTGRAVNIKKGQFLAPWDAGFAVAKVKGAGNDNVMLTERGATFGYNNLVVDFRALPRMRALGVPVCFDATHSVQLPGGQGAASGGEREFIAPLARAAVAVGVDALFFEVHDDPAHALCDGPSQILLEAFPAVLDGILAIDEAARKHPTPCYDARLKPSGGARVSRETARQVLVIESEAVAALAERLDASFDAAVDLLTGCKGRVVVTGMGKSGIVCQKIAATLSSTNTPAYFLHPAEALHGDIGLLVPGDVVLAVSNSGETEELVRCLELIRRLGVPIVALTGRPGSTLARHADVHVDVSVAREACALDLAPTASTTAALAMGDALAVACYERRGFTAKDFARTHPGGRLGRKVLEVRELMREGHAVPRVPVGSTMADAVREMSLKGLGMTCVVDAAGCLAGILTDGDLRRRMLGQERPLDGLVADAMTRTPVTIAPTALAGDALRVLEERKITSLAVADGERRLVGVVQIHDLWRTQLF